MFRRKEDSLFDNNDPQGAPVESATVIPPAQGTPATAATSSAATPATGASAAPAAATTTTPATPSTPSAATPSGFNQGTRTMTDNRPTTPPTANAFRPNAAPLGNDMNRNRMPDAKGPAQPATATTTSAGADKNAKGGRRVLTVGNDILLKGEIATCDRLVIEGKVDATLNDVHTVEIAETGSFKGAAQIEDAEISGLFEGDLVVRNRLVIYATGKVRGKISYGEIEIERGGELTGEIKTAAPQAASGRPARPTNKDDNKFAA